MGRPWRPHRTIQSAVDPPRSGGSNADLYPCLVEPTPLERTRRSVASARSQAMADSPKAMSARRDDDALTPAGGVAGTLGCVTASRTGLANTLGGSLQAGAVDGVDRRPRRSFAPRRRAALATRSAGYAASAAPRRPPVCLPTRVQGGSPGRVQRRHAGRVQGGEPWSWCSGETLPPPPTTTPTPPAEAVTAQNTQSCRSTGPHRAALRRG